ncbi:MAG: TadE/TadG family type IV pilus assembly protein [Pseudomonadota bacterium]
MIFLRDRIQQFVDCERGGPSVEFVVLVLPLMYLIFSIAELGVFMMRSVMLERGVDMAMREVRLGTLAPGEDETEIDLVRRNICENAFLLTGCEDRILIEVAPLTSAANFGSGNAKCVNTADPDISPQDQFTPPGREQITFVRVCLVSEPFFPGVGLGSKMTWLSTGDYAIIAQSAFMNEP